MKILAALALTVSALAGSLDTFTLTDLAGKPAPASTAGRTTVIVFFSTKCPISAAYNDRMSALYRDYSAKDVKFFFVDANANESAAEVIDYSKSASFPFAAFKDQDNQLADRLGAMATPETYIIDRAGTLRYHGAIDDASNEARVKVHALRNALDDILAGREVAKPETKAFGCTIKRVRRTT